MFHFSEFWNSAEIKDVYINLGIGNFPRVGHLYNKHSNKIDLL